MSMSLYMWSAPVITDADEAARLLNLEDDSVFEPSDRLCRFFDELLERYPSPDALTDRELEDGVTPWADGHRLEALGTGADVGTRLRRWLRGSRRRRVAARDRPRAIRRQGDALVAGRPVFGHGDKKRAADEFPSRQNAIRTSVPRSDSDVTRSPSVSLQISPSPRPPPP
jgi:hypothetical protein